MSVLDLPLFGLYMLPLSDIAQQHGIFMQTYADDTQLYISFDHRYLSGLSEAVLY